MDELFELPPDCVPHYEGAVLYAICRHGKVSEREIARQLCMGKTRVNTARRRLIAAGCLLARTDCHLGQRVTPYGRWWLRYLGML